MLSAIPVAFVTVPLTVARLILTSNAIRIGAFLLLGAHLASRGYRVGEGPLSPKMPVTVSPGKGIGGAVYSLTPKFHGVTFRMTKSEANSLYHLIEASLDTASAIPALEDFLHYFPSNRRSVDVV